MEDKKKRKKEMEDIKNQIGLQQKKRWNIKYIRWFFLIGLQMDKLILQKKRSVILKKVITIQNEHRKMTEKIQGLINI